MGISQDFRKLLLIGVCITSVGLKVFLERKKNSLPPHPSIQLSAESAFLQSTSFQIFSLGFDAAIANFLWIRLLQEAEHTRLVEGKVSWEFVQLNTITLLQPKFHGVYPFGTSYLSVFRRDKLGADIILRRWTERQPRSWRAFYTWSYHKYTELKDFAAAAPLMLKAAELPGAPQWIGALGVRLLTAHSAVLHSLHAAVAIYKNLPDTEARYRLRMRIRSLWYHSQKMAWEEALKEYSHAHKSSRPLTLNELTPYWKSPKRNLASLVLDSETETELQPTLSETFEFKISANGKEVEPIDRELNVERLGIYDRKGDDS